MKISAQTWSVQSMAVRVSKPYKAYSHTHCLAIWREARLAKGLRRVSRTNARQNRTNACTHSPQRPVRVCSSFSTWLYRGNRVVAPQSQRYTSTCPAKNRLSSGVGAAAPMPEVGPPHLLHLGWLVQEKKLFLNQCNSSLARCTRSHVPSAAAAAAARSVTPQSSNASAWLCSRSSSYLCKMLQFFDSGRRLLVLLRLLNSTQHAPAKAGAFAGVFSNHRCTARSGGRWLSRGDRCRGRRSGG